MKSVARLSCLRDEWAWDESVRRNSTYDKGIRVEERPRLRRA